MGFTVNMCSSGSPVEALTKSLTYGSNYTCELKDDTSILRPTIIVKTSDNITGYNYMDIREFSRYYFIDDIVSIHNGIWEVSAHVDVLTTYATAIKANSAVIKRQQGKFNLYLDDPEFKTYASQQILTKKFNASGFDKSLHYILVVNGS